MFLSHQGLSLLAADIGLVSSGCWHRGSVESCQFQWPLQILSGQAVGTHRCSVHACDFDVDHPKLEVSLCGQFRYRLLQKHLTNARDTPQTCSARLCEAAFMAAIS